MYSHINLIKIDLEKKDSGRQCAGWLLPPIRWKLHQFAEHQRESQTAKIRCNAMQKCNKVDNLGDVTEGNGGQGGDGLVWFGTIQQSIERRVQVSFIHASSTVCLYILSCHYALETTVLGGWKTYP
jgi:hypothetical protein